MMFGAIPAALIASLLAAVIASLGLMVAVTRSTWAERNAGYFTAFAAGVLVTAALTLFPEAAAATPMAPFAALAGYLLLYGTGVASRGAGGAAVAPMLAIGLHSFIDGLEYGVLFDHDAYLGVVAATGLIAHEFAEGVVLFAALRLAGLQRGAALSGAFVGAALTTPLGALVSQPLIGALDEAQMGLLLGGAAGALLYVGATHLPAHMGGRPRRSFALAYLAGVALSLGLALMHTTMHDDHAARTGSAVPPDRIHQGRA